MRLMTQQVPAVIGRLGRVHQFHAFGASFRYTNTFFLLDSIEDCAETQIVCSCIYLQYPTNREFLLGVSEVVTTRLRQVSR